MTGTAMPGKNRNTPQTEASETDLQEFEKQLRLDLAAAENQIGTWNLDLVGNRITWDSRMFEIYGVDPRDFGDGHETWRKLVVPEDLERVQNELKASQRQSSDLATEFRIIRPDGETRNIRALARTVHAKDGTPAHMVGLNQDITDQKLAQRNLQESEQRFASLLSHLPGMAYRCKNDPNWTMEFVSRGCEALTGYVDGDLIGNRRVSYNDLIHPEDRDRVWSCVQTALKKRRNYEMEYRIRHENGAEKWVWERGAGYFANEDEFLFLEGFVSDITIRKQAETDLFEREEHLSITLNSIGDAVISTNTEGRIDMMNPVAEELTGWKLADALGKPLCEVFRIINETSRKAMDSPVDLVLASGKTIGLANHTLLIAKDDREIPIADSGAPIRNCQGRVSGVVLVFRDQTDERNAQNALEKSESQYRSLFENMSAAFALNEVVSDEQGNPADFRLLETNSAFERLTGLVAEESKGKTAKEIARNIGLDWRDMLEHVFRTGTPVQEEQYSALLEKHFVVRAFPPKQNQVAVFFSDITEQKLVQKRLELTQFALDHAADPAYWVNSDGSLAYVNDAACRALGYTRDELLRLSLPDIDPDFDFSRWPEHWEKTRKTKTATIETRHQTKNGSSFPVEIHANFLRFGTQEYHFTFAHNIAERKRAEEQIADLARFPTENPNPVFRVMTDGTLVYANAAAACLLPKSTDMRKSFWWGHIQTALETNHPCEIEFRQEGRAFLVSFSPIAERGYVNVYAHDISALKKTEAALQESRKYLERMWDSMNIGILLVDAETREILRINPALLEMSGYREKELIGKVCHHLVCPADQNKCPVGDLGQLIDQSERKLVRIDGREIDVEKTVTPIMLAGREVYLETLVDISKRLDSERKLRELSNIQSLILNNSMLGIALVKNRVFSWVNPRLCKLLDVPQSQLQGASTHILYPSEDVFENVGSQAYRALRRGKRFDLVLRFRRKDGSLFWCRMVGKAIDPKHPQDGSLWMFEDITESEEAKQELVRLSTAIEQSPETVVITDLDGKILYTNPAFEKISGYAQEEALGKDPSIFKSNEHDKAFYADLWGTIESGRIWTGRIVNKRKDGTLYTEEVTISPVKDPDGNLANYVAVKRDITDEIILEEELRHSQKMEAVGQLAGGVAHDFNNILQAILGFGQLLQSDMDKESEEYGNVEQIIKAAQRARKLTRQLLTFSHKQPARLAEVDINTAIYDAEVLLHMLLGKKYEIVLELEQNLHAIQGDYGQISQVVMNLALNARDAMPDGGRLTLTTDNIALGQTDLPGISGAHPGDYICLTVTDTGCGMDQTVKERLFEPFFTTKEVGKGSGLGLSVVYGIIQQNKGWITVYSEKDMGSSFKIHFPAYHQNPCAEKESPAPAADGKKILLVEDDDNVGAMVMEILENSNYRVVRTDSAEQALLRISPEEIPFDLLMSDMVLPGMNGEELADTVRRMHPSLPILLYSGYRDQKNRWKTIPQKDYHFTHKPFTTTGILSKIREALDH